MNEELKSLYKNRTWELVKPSKGHWLQWVFKKKDGSTEIDAACCNANSNF